MEHILPNHGTIKEPLSLSKRLIGGVLKVSENIRGGFEKLLSNPKDRKWSQLLEQIRNRINNPRYLDTNDAIRDFESLVFIVYRDKLIEGKSDREAYQIRKELLRFVLFLRRLSNSSGLIQKRQSGYSAFSHWMDAVYIYLENESHPTLQGIQEIAAHDSLEDPNFNLPSKSSQIRWKTSEKVRQQLIKYSGHQVVETVETKFTKPEISGKHVANGQHEIWHKTTGQNEQERSKKFFSQIPTKHYEEARAERNKEYLSHISLKLDDVSFRKKMADALSNIRNVDAFLLDNGSPTQIREGRAKMERKCSEMIEYFLPRAKDIAPSYYVQMVSELESLKSSYSLQIDLNGHTFKSEGFKKAIRQSRIQGIEFVKVYSRTISEKMVIKRIVLEARRRKF